MDDVLHCPICGNKLRNRDTNNKLLHEVGKTSDYTRRLCVNGRNHMVIIWVDRVTQQVDLVKLSLKPNYSRFIEADFVNQKCRISCLKNGLPAYIEIEKMLDLDFPALNRLKEQVSMFITFS